MDIWCITQDGFDRQETVANGNRFLLANGYMGYRGTVDEWGAAECAAVNLAGVYDRHGDKWREPVNAPNPLYAEVRIAGKAVKLGETEPLSHRVSLDLRRAVFTRDTAFPGLRIESRRIVSMAEPHLLASRITLTFDADGVAELIIGVSTDIWDLNGPHLFDFAYAQDNPLIASARTGELGIGISSAQACRADFSYTETRESGQNGVFRKLCFEAKAGESRTIELFGAVYTALDGAEPEKSAREQCDNARALGFDGCLKAHENVWETIWSRCEVELAGDEEAARALNASLYHLNSIAPRHAKALSIPARGLSGQTYKGAVFWDSEMFLFPFFVHTQPGLAKSLLRYRIETLPGALKKASEYGFRGAFYAWESQEGGAEGCSDYNVTDVFTGRPVRTHFRDKQIHISADVVYALWRYYELTGDRELLLDGGAEVILQCARFYLSRARRRLDGDAVELADVIGPDEYHERVTNNAYTNMLASYCMDCALNLGEVFRDDPEYMRELIKKLDYAADMALLVETSRLLRSTVPESGLVEQFRGYFRLEDASLAEVRSRLLDPREYWGTDRGVASGTQIIKQADVIAMMALLPECFSKDQTELNWDYYEPRTEHGSSLSACMYGLTACRIKRPGPAWEQFMKTASIDIVGGGKQWAGGIYIGGTHPAANGGAWIIAVQGFAGLSVDDGKIKLDPCLPEQIRSMRFHIELRGKRYTITVTHNGYSVEEKE